MKTVRNKATIFGRFATTATLVAVLVVASSGVASAATSHKKKQLSLANVTIQGTTSGINAPLWVASQEGFFKKQGVNVTVATSTLSSAAIITVLLSGTWQFLTSIPSAVMLAAQQGTPVRAVAQLATSTCQELALSSAFVAAHNVPNSGNSTKGATAQLLALKGSHATIAVSNTASDSYNWFVAMARLNGLTVAPGGDVNVVSSGTVPTLVAGLLSGKYDGIINSPPTTVQPNSIIIQLFRIKPASLVGGVYTFATTDFIKQHPDTVQAVVTAEMQAREFILQHTAKAQRDTALWFAKPEVGITSPETASYLFTVGYLQFDKHPFYPGRTGFLNELKLINLAQPTPISLSFPNFVYTKFAATALKELNLS